MKVTSGYASSDLPVNPNMRVVIAAGVLLERTEIYRVPPLPGAKRLTLEPGYLVRMDRGRWIVAYIDRSADGSELWLGVHVQGQRDHLKWFSGLHPLGKSFCVGNSAHAVSHLETHFDAQGHVRAVVLDVL